MLQCGGLHANRGSQESMLATDTMTLAGQVPRKPGKGGWHRQQERVLQPSADGNESCKMHMNVGRMSCQETAPPPGPAFDVA